MLLAQHPEIGVGHLGQSPVEDAAGLGSQDQALSGPQVGGLVGHVDAAQQDLPGGGVDQGQGGTGSTGEGELARTGSDTTGLVLLGLALVACGGAVTFAVRRSQTTAS